MTGRGTVDPAVATEQERIDAAVATLVVHGTADPLFPLAHGEAPARSIPGGRLLALTGVGHQLPPPTTWEVVVDALVEHTGAG